MRTLSRRVVTLSIVAALLLAVCSFAGEAKIFKSSKPIAGSYIVVLKDDAIRARGGKAATVANDLTLVHGGRLTYIYDRALHGFATRMSQADAERLAQDPRVAYVEEDGRMAIVTTQSGATWGIDRIDQHNLPLSGTFTYFNTGAGVKAYIIDTGIRFSHNQFGGRAVSGFDAVDGGTADDCNGHGTHVSGTVGGSTYGVAKGVTLVAVRVLDCNGSGSTSGVIAGVNWVTSDHAAGQPAVANMSLGGGASTALDTAVQNSINDGVAYAVAAGNGNALGVAQNACNSSPARVAAAMTISATTSADAKPSWANFGNCVDWFAPGVNITSSWYTSNTATNTISGTSMATPHTTGVAALYLQSNPGATPAQVRTALFNLTTKGIVTSSNTTNNHLLFTNF